MSKFEKTRGCLDVIYSSVMESKYRSAVKTVQMMRNELDAVEKWIAELEAENKRLKEREELLDALEAAGVDNWEGYSYAIEELKGGEK